MKTSLLTLISCLLISTAAFSQTIYTFTGNGLWTNSANWSANTIPPTTLPSGSTIYISPTAGDSCVLDTIQTLAPGSNLIVSSGANLILKEGMIINNADLPVVITDSVFSITDSSINAAGELSSYGSDTLLAEGFVWDTLQTPIVSVSPKNNMGTGATTGPFNGQINNLKSNTTYYLRAYATNSFGTAYGNEINFLTKQYPSGLVTDSPTNITSTSAQLNAVLANGAYVSIIAKGFSIDTTTDIQGDGVVTESSTFIVQSDTGLTNYYAVANNLLPSTAYIYAARVIQSNKVDDSYFGAVLVFNTLPTTPVTVTTQPIANFTASSVTSGGSMTGNTGSAIVQKGIAWSIYPNPNVLLNSSVTNNGQDSGAYTSTLTGLNPGTMYYVRAYILTAGRVVYYGNQVSFTCPLPPMAITLSPVTSSISSSGAAINGIAENENGGAFPIVQRGIVYSSFVTTPILSTGISSLSGTGDGSFNCYLFGLTSGTTYYYRAFATNSLGVTAYGSVLSFQTSP